MNDQTLIDRRCRPCEGQVKPLPPAAIANYQRELKYLWQVEEDKKISAEFRFGNFREAMVFINKIAPLAEHEGHHPDLHIFYSRVRVELWTHATGGLTENDFILAAKIEKLV